MRPTRFLSLLLTLLAFTTLSAHDLIDEEKNHLLFPANHVRFDSLQQKILQIQTSGEGHLNVLHIGGSHVQAGYFSHRLRQHFCNLLPQSYGQRGILFPWKAINTNAPTHYYIAHTGHWKRVRCIDQTHEVPLGLSGAAAITSDTLASLTVYLRDHAEQWAFNRLRVLGQNLSQNKVEPVIIMNNGDTLRHTEYDEQLQSYLFQLPEKATDCQVAFCGMEQDSSAFCLRGLWVENDNPGVTYTAAGVNGAAVPSWLRCERFQQELSALCPPDLVIFGIGINDANVPHGKFDTEKFKQNYRDLIARLQAANPEVALLFVTNNDCYLRVGKQKKTFNKNTRLVQQAMMELATEYDAAVWDQYEIMGGYGSSDHWVKKKMMNRDHIHFLKDGYELLADKLWESFSGQHEEMTDTAANEEED